MIYRLFSQLYTCHFVQGFSSHDYQEPAVFDQLPPRRIKGPLLPAPSSRAKNQTARQMEALACSIPGWLMVG